MTTRTTEACIYTDRAAELCAAVGHEIGWNGYCCKAALIMVKAVNLLWNERAIENSFADSKNSHKEVKKYNMKCLCDELFQTMPFNNLQNEESETSHL